jgi:hypothetical protein
MRNYRTIATIVTVALLLGVLSACSGGNSRSVLLGTYVSQLCDAIGPFERDAQKRGRLIGRGGLRPASRNDEQALGELLTYSIGDATRAVTTLRVIGAPDITDGPAFATAMVTTLERIKKSDVMWRSELRATDRARPSPSRMNQERLRPSLQALILVGRQIERLPITRERENAMARSAVCNDLFGSGALKQDE